ncbi:MAG: cobyrinate a,c-diamide synthase [Deltaproteobacteria bacterium]|nr:cobyrinate a,c-diamide synthase [Deltaproteobacteria bacterium]MBW1952063.1 cobyrinate a,c-diamide synthase [Deltaproteobacteria bacterium]MBW1986988.1 cobyrinate a,c-diamide synthase [Deltaproteobacteria bacterium]MBW2134055.1 cobyrinate a,c-diamide synthase [Deltaproteobacteria bacterium]
MPRPCPRLVLTALRGGAGKTTLTLGLLAAWRQQGRAVVPFKKGPDYIDPAWHSLAAGRACYNLDPFLMDRDQVLASVAHHAAQADGVLIEGNRGLYDGLDVEGTSSTAELAKLLQAPVVLVVDCTMTTRTAAALVLGCQRFDVEVALRAVVLNQIARPRHEEVLRAAIERYCGLPVLGAIPRLKCAVFPERHMGLVPPQEHRAAHRAVATALDLAQKYLDIDRLWELADQAPFLPSGTLAGGNEFQSGVEQVVIGIVRDSAFQFYYPENLELLTRLGARLVEINALQDHFLPLIDALYIGGGFPETHAAALANNESLRRCVWQAAEGGLPIYAECGGLMYLGESLVLAGQTYPMAGVLPLSFKLGKRPQGHGYTIAAVEGPNPFFPVGTQLRGHEFHYSRVINSQIKPEDMVFRLQRGQGIIEQRDGVCYKNVLATFTHIHALGTAGWAEAVVHQALKFRDQNRLARSHLPPACGYKELAI